MDQVEADECITGYIVACEDKAGGLYVFQPICLSREDAEICQKRNEFCLFGTPKIIEILVTPGKYKKAIELQQEMESGKGESEA